MGPGWSRSLGLVVDETHPVFKNFPTAHHGGWQWEEILEEARGFLMDQMPEGLKPVVTAIDDWNRNLPLALMFEGRVGAGRLLFVSACLEGSFEERPAACSLKQAILDYAASESFSPEAVLTAEAVESHLFPLLLQEKLGTKFTFDEDAAVEDAAALLDLNPNRSVSVRRSAYPVTITMSLEKRVKASGLAILPEQKDRMHEGGICQCAVEVLENGGWNQVWTGTLRNSSMTQRILFPEEYETEAIRITVLSSYGTRGKMEWRSSFDGWHQEWKEEEVLVSVAAIHVISQEPSEERDEMFWNGRRKSTTKEIED